VPNALAASQVSINLSSTYAPWPLTIVIRMSRDGDIEAARKLAIAVAGEIAGEKAVTGCFLTRVEANAAVLELRLQAPDRAARDTLHATLLARLSQRFSEFDLPAGGERPSFA
jgi:hypothetical protein